MDIHLDLIKWSRFPCPVCNELSEIHGIKEREPYFLMPRPIQRLIHQPVDPCQPLVGPADMLMFDRAEFLTYRRHLSEQRLQVRGLNPVLPLQLLDQQFAVTIMLHIILAVACGMPQCSDQRLVFGLVVGPLPDIFRLFLNSIPVLVIDAVSNSGRAGIAPRAPVSYQKYLFKF